MRDIRGKLYKTVDVNSNKEYDYLDSSLLDYYVEGDVVEYIIPQKFEGRLYLVANIFYGNPKLWWIIAYVNDIENPITETVTGKTLIIPSINSFMTMYIKNIKQDDVIGSFRNKLLDNL